MFPIAGPPCFLDDELWQFNDIFGDEGNIFPDQQVFIDEYRERGHDNGVVLLPGSVAELTGDECTVTHPVPDVGGSSRTRRSTCRRTASGSGR